MTEYTTVQGDTFELIAWRELGDSTRMDEIIRLNRAHMETATFSAGEVLTLPDREEDAGDAKPTGTPPWRRGSGA